MDHILFLINFWCTNDTQSSLIKDYFEMIGSILTLIAILFGIYQYRKAQKWKRLEFVSNEITKFESDKNVTNARLMLDWQHRSIELYFDATEWDYKSRFVEINDKILKSSLTIPDNDPEPEIPFSEDEIRIRDTFDVLFSYFAAFYANIQTGLVTFDEYYPYIKYWLDILSNPANKKKDKEFKKLISDFLKNYGYSGVICLFNEHLKRITNK